MRASRIRRVGRLVACLAVVWMALAFPRGAAAEDPRQWLTTVPKAEDGLGIKVGNRSLFHPGLAVTTGWDSNVFNANEQNATERSAFFVMPSVWLGIGNRRIRDGLLDSPPQASEYKFDYAIEALAGYRFYLSGNERIRGAGKFNTGARVRMMALPGRRFSFGIEDDFLRICEPQRLEGLREFNLNRIVNNGRIRLIFRPGGGRFSIEADYLNELLFFERLDITTGDRFVNGALAEVKWRIRDRSAFVARYTFHNTVYTCCVDADSGRNEDSNRHKVYAGYEGQIGKKWDFELLGGYGSANYYNDDNGPNFSGPLARVGLIFYPTPRTALRALFFRDFQDSLQGNYAIDTGGGLFGEHTFRWRMILQAGATVVARRTAGLPNPAFIDAVGYVDAAGLIREDVLITGSVKIEQPLGRIFSVALGYTARAAVTDFAIDQFLMDADGNNVGVDRLFGAFNRHVIMLFGAVRY